MACKGAVAPLLYPTMAIALPVNALSWWLMPMVLTDENYRFIRFVGPYSGPLDWLFAVRFIGTYGVFIVVVGFMLLKLMDIGAWYCRESVLYGADLEHPNHADRYLMRLGYTPKPMNWCNVWRWIATGIGVFTYYPIRGIWHGLKELKNALQSR